MLSLVPKYYHNIVKFKFVHQLWQGCLKAVARVSLCLCSWCDARQFTNAVSMEILLLLLCLRQKNSVNIPSSLEYDNTACTGPYL